MNTKIDISSLDEATNAKLNHYIELARKLEKGIPVDITPKLVEKPVFIWSDGLEGFVTPHSSHDTYCKYGFDWEDLRKQEKTITDKYNDLIKEICDFSDSVADSLSVDKTEFFNEFFL